MGLFNKIFGFNDKPQNNTTVNTENSQYEFYGESDRIWKKYEKVVNMHYKLLEKINMNYTVVMNLGDEFSPQMDQVIEDCKRDIAIAQTFYDYCKETAEYYNDPIENHLPTYDSFKRLAIIYEKRKEYDKALAVCQTAIDIGFYKDGTAGQIPGRMARLYKKLNKLG